MLPKTTATGQGGQLIVGDDGGDVGKMGGKGGEKGGGDERQDYERQEAGKGEEEILPSGSLAEDPEVYAMRFDGISFSVNKIL